MYHNLMTWLNLKMEILDMITVLPMMITSIVHLTKNYILGLATVKKIHPSSFDVRNNDSVRLCGRTTFWLVAILVRPTYCDNNHDLSR